MGRPKLTPDTPYICSTCGSEEFKWSGRNRRCKPCALKCTEKWVHGPSEKAKAYFARRKELNRERLREKARFLRARVLKEYGSACGGCGETNEIVLDLDHVNGRVAGTKRSWDTDYRKAIQLGSPNKEYQLLCRNCNWIKFRTGTVPNRKEDEAQTG